ncbi:hypothetical protein KIPB_011325, partial [Kipferlia bialata]
CDTIGPLSDDCTRELIVSLDSDMEMIRGHTGAYPESPDMAGCGACKFDTNSRGSRVRQCKKKGCRGTPYESGLCPFHRMLLKTGLCPDFPQAEATQEKNRRAMYDAYSYRGSVHELLVQRRAPEVSNKS